MPLVPRWLRNEPIESTSTSAGKFEVSNTARRHQRNRHASGPGERDFSITCNLGGFTGVGIPWSGTSHEDARDSFIEYIVNHDEFGLGVTDPYRFFRSTYVNFKGKHQLLVFRTNWITGFTVG